MIKDEDGFTIIEILIAMMIFTLILSMVGSVFVFSTKQMIKWRQSVQTLSDIHIASEIMYKDILTASTIVVTDSLIKITANGNKEQQYQEIKHHIKRNELLIADNADSHYVNSFSISDSINIIKTRYIRDNKIRLIELVVAHRQPMLWGKLE
jgi:prepilin-type N-terminal cleavage/methylation domain-containing protein